MKRILGALTALSLCLGPVGTASADHIVTPRALADRVGANAAQRDDDVRVVERVLSTPRAAAAATALGARIDDVRSAVPSLGDRELRDLAQRASALRVDPVSGHIDADVNDFLIIFLVVAIVVVVIAAVR
jgi:hypothetical protein